MIMYFVFLVLLLGLAIIGWFRILILNFLVIIGTMVIAIPALIAFGDYYMIGFLLILINIVISTMGIIRTKNDD